jgi:hypothetical protein
MRAPSTLRRLKRGLSSQMAKRKPDENVLKECRDVHFPYELWMLEETYERLKGLGSGVCRNILIESFCIHARNLIEFYRGSEKNDYMKAKFFTKDGIYKPKHVGDPDGEIGRELYGKLNQQIAHLTKDRTSDPGKKIGHAAREAIFEAIQKETALFVSLMDSPLAATIKTRGPNASATNAITTASLRVLGNEDRS